MFLYFLSNTLYKNGVDLSLCEKIFYLNKVLHGIDVFYELELPDIFLFVHPVGTVLGRAQYSDYLLVYQKCTIGSSHDVGDYPILGKYLAIYEGSSILGNCLIGDNCKFAAHSLIIDQDLDSNKIYIGTPSNYITQENKYHDRIWDIKSNM
jgi:serine O-acetyltransferase